MIDLLHHASAFFRLREMFIETERAEQANKATIRRVIKQSLSGGVWRTIRGHSLEKFHLDYGLFQTAPPIVDPRFDAAG